MSISPKTESVLIREVWNENLESEFALIREIVDKYPYIAMDTEFPGVVLRPMGTFKNINDYNYQTLKDNVDMLKLIQLGLTFSDANGNLPTCGTDKLCIWQFNFREFDVTEDVFASDSIQMLQECGMDFKKNNEKGIDVNQFGELLMSSGIVLNDNVSWVTFHSGYDFGYLLKLLTRRSLPGTQAGFFDLINMYFPMVYDIKHLMKFCNSLHGGLNKLAELLEVERVGICHQAGSDSLLTSCTFRKLRDSFFNGSTEKYAGVFGLVTPTTEMETKRFVVQKCRISSQSSFFRTLRTVNLQPCGEDLYACQVWMQLQAIDLGKKRVADRQRGCSVSTGQTVFQVSLQCTKHRPYYGLNHSITRVKSVWLKRVGGQT
ncbi:hypothetical protein VitviT2T_004848 [Vitis vinifera]|uniref:poly(A)-specific ribonuclease n=1 Tax=Vitis vinifera TaxID=29760 RepID=A0ABY9BQQ6_VITVI|nr:hypothetical protein VitviT2T_004848 [Vitis vinifera]